MSVAALAGPDARSGLPGSGAQQKVPCMAHILLPLLLSVLQLSNPLAQVSPQGEGDLLAPYREQSRLAWEEKILLLEERDRSEQDPEEPILFVGSSSIRRWDTIAEDMTPWPVIQRGFGGARTSDVAVYAERLLHPHEYRALVLFVANDVRGAENDHTPFEVEALFRHIRKVSRLHRPDAPVFLIEVTPTRSRWPHWSRIRQVNARLRELALTSADTWFIATAEHYLDRDKEPRDELFVEDRLHLNRVGYELWGTLIRQRLAEVLGHANSGR